jgi:KaiC/GvpD/RAD55 family RecA-like ATPase
MPDKPNIFDTAVASNLLQPEKPVEPLYMGIYPGGVTLINGETGRGKTSMLYNLLGAATTGLPLWGASFKEVQKHLALDPENNDGIRYERLERIGFERTDRLWFESSSRINLKDPAHVNDLCEYLLRYKFTMLSIDPVARLFDTKDENSNSEANQEMGMLIHIAQQTNCAVIAVHHTGKGAKDSYGRGASARLGAAHVGMTYRTKSDDDDEIDDDWGVEQPKSQFIARLQVVKNRFQGGSTSLFLKSMAEGIADRFSRTTFDEWKASGVKSETLSTLPASERAAGTITTILNNEYRWMPGAELRQVAKASGVSDSAFREAMQKLMETGAVVRKELGKNNEKGYALRAFAELQQDMDI